ncbi:ribonuclease domain-containing protein [Streptomyces spinosus]|uniref:ribonuclease domain-containing protein n=1 Tax=Streptomyces spinosus TaxID=2872623 RepID=UPI0035586732
MPPRRRADRTAAAAPARAIRGGNLPAYDTLGLIERGGPFPYAQDGTVFQNRERVLPGRPSGYYHEYTVITPGSPTRGARRIVTGDEDREDYCTSDHYATSDLVDFGC